MAINSQGGKLFILINNLHNQKVMDIFVSLTTIKILIQVLTLSFWKKVVQRSVRPRPSWSLRMSTFRIKAMSLGLPAEDYTTDQVDEISFASNYIEMEVKDASSRGAPL